MSRDGVDVSLHFNNVDKVFHTLDFFGQRKACYRVVSRKDWLIVERETRVCR